METPISPGRVGNLTAEQDERLREMWAGALKIFGRAAQSGTNGTPDASAAKDAVPSGNGNGNGSTNGSNGLLAPPEAGGVAATKKRGRLARMLSRTSSTASDVPTTGSGAITPTLTSTTSNRSGDDADSSTVSANAAADSLAGLDLASDVGDKYGQSAEFKKALATQTPDELRDEFWSMVKADHPDSLLLRFLRARRWDVGKALIMLVSTMAWRGPKEMDVERLVREGELHALESGDDEFMLQVRKGKSILHGTDADGRPVCIVRSRLHRPAEQSAQTMERYTVHIMETCRLMLRGPIDTATVIFDLSNIEAKYMDLGPVKFIIKCFEAHYPESLGICCIYGAPWFFRPVWSIVKGLLDPVVAEKIRFANTEAELATFLPQADIIKELGGPRDWAYSYIEPVPGENDTMKDTATRDALLKERKVLVDRFEALTRAWCENAHTSGTTPLTAATSDAELRRQREDVAKELEKDYWKLDPYLRAKTHYDRQGYIEHDGRYNPRATFSSEEDAAAGAGAGAGTDGTTKTAAAA